MQHVVRAERVVAGGDALGRLDDGRVVFVPGLVPGETAEVRIVDDRRDFARAAVVALIEPSPARVVPECEARHRGCGGCDWMHLSVDAQRTWKIEVVRDALRRTARLPDAAIRWGGAVAPWGYRTSLRVAAAGDGRLGLRAADSNEVVPLSHCPVAAPALDALLAEVRLRRAPSAQSRRRARGERLRRDERDEVSLRVSTATGAATIGAPPTVCDRLERVPVGVAVGDDARLTERVGDVALDVSAASFFQSGPEAAALLVATVQGLLAPLSAADSRQGVLVDAYGGVGLFAASLGWQRAVVVESSASACADARRNLGDGVEVVQSTMEEWDGRARTDIDVVVADPARAGLGRHGVESIARLSAATVVLVSCDPVAMARDVAGLVEHGFRHVEAVVLDLFPQTHHVEVVTLLTR